jgi:crotonobetainyl-CoA:carnitine CoA-transferase CaiB-like acyl-CoA transferase
LFDPHFLAVNAVANATGPLAGIRILDLTQFLSGPYATQILADMGAEVIKLEAPQGDLARHIPPHFIDGDSLYYVGINRNKKSLVIDLKQNDGIELARRIVGKCDVVIENFRPGILDKLGLSSVELRKADPRLIWCSISGFGQDGPYKDKPAYDMIVQALSGGMSLTGEPGRIAVRAGIPIGDLTAGMYAAIGILGALLKRGQTGEGDTIDISMLDGQVAFLCYQAAYYLFSGKVPGRQGSAHDSIPTYRTFLAKDGREVVVTANTERMWADMANSLGVEELTKDPRFITNRERHQNRLELWPLLEKAFLAHNADEWVTMFEAKGIPVGVVNTLDRVMTDPQILHRNMILELEAEDGRKARVVGDPLHFSESYRDHHRYPPALGEDSVDVLGEVLGLSAEDIARLIKARTAMDRETAKVKS